MPSNVLLLNKARASHARGDFDAAARDYENILKLDPRNYEAAYLLGVAHYQAGRLERAAAGFGLAASLNPRKQEAHKDRGLVLMKLGQHEAALASFEAATKLSASSPELLVNRGLAQKNTGRIAESIESYQAALRLKPGFAEAHNNLANSLSLLGRKEEALASYTKAFTLKPGYGEACVNAAALLVELDRSAEAKPLLERAIAANPRHAEAHRTLAVCLDRLGQAAEALAAATRAVELGPNSADAYVTRASLLAASGMPDAAIADYASALALDPRNMEALIGKAYLLFGQGRHDETIALCDTAIAVDPADARPYYRIGRALEALKEPGAAIRSYEKAMELDHAWFSPVLHRASMLGELGRYEEALAGFDQAAALKPDSADAHLGRADALRSLRRPEEALGCYDQAIAIAQDRPLLYGARATVRSELGDSAGALDDIGQSLGLVAAGSPAAQSAAEDCLRLLSVDKIPAIYATEEELASTRARVETVLGELAAEYDGHVPLTAEQTQVSEQAIRHLTGFYLAYHQRNDRDAMMSLSLVAGRLLSLPPQEIAARGAGGRIRVGIASQRLRNHNGANWSYNWFAGLPRDDYEFFTYGFEQPGDALGEKFARLGTHRNLTWSRSAPHEIVELVRNDALDILMLPDVGMTPVSRFLSLHRMAPCQFTAWGHPVTTGSQQMDFYLSSDLMEPADAQAHYSETLVRMPNLALYLDEVEAEGTVDRAEFGLPQGRVLYGCLQSLFKYLPRHDDILPRIAREVPDALFVFIEGAPAYTTAIMQERLARAFAAHGLDAARHVTFVPRQKPAGFDRLMQAMDLCIDTIGWSGGNTSLKNINFAVPLATAEGSFMRGRHTSAMFRMMGVEDLIAASTDGYVEILVQLGREEARRRYCADLFRAHRHRLYRDQSFITAFDRFLKSQRPG